MKHNLLLASEFEIVHDCFRSFSFNLLATPKNFIIRQFVGVEFNMFRVINREDSDKIELRSHVGESTYIDKEEVKKAFGLNKTFVMLLKNSGHKIVIPKPNFEWLFSTGREDVKWKPTKSETGHFILEFNDKFDKDITLAELTYCQHPRVNDLADVHPF